MNPSDRAWQSLVTAARRANDDRDTAAPYGFATRVAALAITQPARPLASLFERFSWRALGVAGLLAAVSIGSSLSASSTAVDDDVLSDEGTVATLFGASQ